MRTAAALLFLLLSSAAGSAAECTDMASEMRQANNKYRVAVGDLRVLARDLGPAGMRSEEAVLRSLRSYSLAQRDLRDLRLQIIGLYRHLVDGDCEPFDQQGYEATLQDFRFVTKAEEAVLSQARRVMMTSADIR